VRLLTRKILPINKDSQDCDWGRRYKKLTSSADQQEPPPPPRTPSSILDLDRIIGKNVRTVDYQNVGKVIDVVENEDAIIISSEGAHSTYNYGIPKNLIQGFDGPDLMLSIARTKLADYEVNDIKDYAAQLKSIKTEQKEGREEQEIIVPVVEEKLRISKKVITDEVTIIKEPVIETKIIEFPLMHEEIVIEKRPATPTPASAAEEGDTAVLDKPSSKNTRTQIRIPLIHEVVKIKKEPYVKEEIVISKKPRTETKTVTDFVISEKVDTSNNTVTQSF
jgi:uncharacterized protein (TIGR02271 family)